MTEERVCPICGAAIEVGDHVVVQRVSRDDALAMAWTDPEGSYGIRILHEGCEGLLEGARLSVQHERRVKAKLKGIVGR